VLFQLRKCWNRAAPSQAIFASKAISRHQALSISRHKIIAARKKHAKAGKNL
jgi:hypothetical protein